MKGYSFTELAKLVEAAMPRSGGAFSGNVSAPRFIGPLQGNADTATAAGRADKLSTARNITIGSTTKAFDGTGNLSWSLAEIGAINASATVAAANKWATPRALQIGNSSKAVDGTANVAWSLAEMGAVNKAGDTITGAIRFQGDGNSLGELKATTGGNLHIDAGKSGTSGAPGLLYLNWYSGSGGVRIGNGAMGEAATIYSSGAATFRGAVTAPSFSGALSGNASTATQLQNTRNINGTGFNGTGNIETSYWGAARTLTIGSAGKAVNGSGNVAWSLAEMGAVNKAGDTMTGVLNAPRFSMSSATGSAYIIGGGDGASSTVSNLILRSWYGIGFSPSISGQPIPEGENAVYINVRTGALTARGTITAPTFSGALSGNASTATKLATARTLTIGKTGKAFDGTANVSWSLGELGVLAGVGAHGTNWYKLATVVIGQPGAARMTVYGGSGYNVGSWSQANKMEVVIRGGNSNPKGLTIRCYAHDASLRPFTEICWINTSGDTYDIYVKGTTHAQGLLAEGYSNSGQVIQWYWSDTGSATMPTGATAGQMIQMYNTANKPTAADVGALAVSDVTGGGKLSSASALLVGDTSHKSLIRTSSTTGEYLFGGRRDTSKSDMEDYIRIGRNKLIYTTNTSTSYNIYHQGYKPTAADVGALASTGGTMTGALRVDAGQGTTPGVWVGASGSSYKAGIGVSAAAADAIFGVSTDRTAFAGFLRVGTKLSYQPNGSAVEYNVYHQGFKPTAADVGAVNKAGDTMTGDFAVSGNTQFGPSADRTNWGAPAIRSLMNGLIEVVAPANSAGTSASGIVFHNRGTSTSAIYYKNENTNSGSFHFKSDDSTYDVRINGSKVYNEGYKPTAADVGALPSNGNAVSATKLATARTLTIGATAKSFNGSQDVSWTLYEMGLRHSTLATASTTATDRTVAFSIDSSQWAINSVIVICVQGDVVTRGVLDVALMKEKPSGILYIDRHGGSQGVQVSYAFSRNGTVANLRLYSPSGGAAIYMVLGTV